MVKSNASTPEEYLDGLSPERREAIARVRRVVLDNLPEGYEEGMQYGMIGYYIPLERYPDTYNKQPLGVAALASQKNYMALYLMGCTETPSYAGGSKRALRPAARSSTWANRACASRSSTTCRSNSSAK